MEHLTDVVISKVYEGKSDVGKYGPWTAFNLYLEGQDKKFSWFGGDKKITPVEGMHLKHVGYEIKQDGEYTNYNIKEMELMEDSPQPSPSSTPPPLPGKAPNGREASFYVSYMKDIAVAVLNCGGGLEQTDLDAIARKIAQAGLVMMNESLGNAVTSSEEPKKAFPVNGKPKPKSTPPIDKANDPRKDMIKCEVVKEDGSVKHSDPVSAIYCLTSCMETAHCSMAKDLREKYPGHELE